ncbi:hypothetical protein [Chelativorans sp.]|uniref:hypothetical protein n=1 Tax=Chelativorans sp. TaxID=2203393 RepID=UPI002812648F|nr:hypothetical protein [Chelativorans sp.]
MPTLPLAIDIADTVASADPGLDTGAKADELLEAHPEADATREDVRETLEEELRSLDE